MERILLVDENRRIYIPQFFISNYGHALAHPSPTEVEYVKGGPYQSDYWECWDAILEHATVTIDGKQYTLEEDGDLWAVPVEEEDNDIIDADKWDGKIGH